VTKYLLDHQWVFDSRYNLNCTTALLTRFNVDVKVRHEVACEVV
jgi:hypothetical protein